MELAVVVVVVVVVVVGAALLGLIVLRSARKDRIDVDEWYRNAHPERLDPFGELGSLREELDLHGPLSRGWAPVDFMRRERSSTREARTPVSKGESVSRQGWIHVGEVFSPAAPVHREDLFAGRNQQMEDLVNVVFERGQHAAIFGERGVGKTSLATVLSSTFSELENKLVVRVNCDATDDFDSIWRKVIDETKIVAALRSDDSSGEIRNALQVAVHELEGIAQIRPNDVRKLMRVISSVYDVIVFVDEFERLTDPSTTSFFAETVKVLSDQSIAATIVIVGVADNLEELLSEHGSIERALVQIHMPRMSNEELADIIDRSLQMLDMKIDDASMTTIVSISRGLPHITHLIGQAAARAAIETGDQEISFEHVNDAIEKLSYRTQGTVLNAYSLATSSKRDTIYPQVLLACALAPNDGQGLFTASDVVAPLRHIMGRPYPIPSFSRHLHALSEKARGPALQRKGSEHRYRFRFMNPLLQPYVLIKGMSDQVIGPRDLDRFRRNEEIA